MHLLHPANSQRRRQGERRRAAGSGWRRSSGLRSDVYDKGDVFREYGRSRKRSLSTIKEQSSDALARGPGNETQSGLSEQRRLSDVADNEVATCAAVLNSLCF